MFGTVLVGAGFGVKSGFGMEGVVPLPAAASDGNSTTARISAVFDITSISYAEHHCSVRTQRQTRREDIANQSSDALE
jgi:hypothetical protein